MSNKTDLQVAEILPDCAPKKDCRYFQNHQWQSAAENGTRFGIDAFLAALLPRVKEVVLPSSRTVLRAGEPVAWLMAGDVVIELPAMVWNVAIDPNPELARHPEWVRTDPYGKGYLFTTPVHHSEMSSAPVLSTHEVETVWNLDLNYLRRMAGRVIDDSTNRSLAADGGRSIQTLHELFGPDDYRYLLRPLLRA